MEELDGYTKAAILVMSLGEDAASDVMKTLAPKMLQRLGSKISDMTEISQKESEVVFKEYAEFVGESSGISVEGKSYMKNVLQKALGKDKADRVIENMIETEESGLDTLKWMDAKGVASLIRGEHPQTVALILTYLDPAQGSEILPLLPDALRGDVMIRMATLEDIPPGVMKEIGTALQNDLSQAGSASKTATSKKVSGVKLVANILNQVDKATEKSIMESISENHANLSEDIRKLMFVFDDLNRMDDRGMQELLKVVSKEQLLLALKAAQDDIKDLVFRNMSERAREMLQEDMESKGPVKVSEVEAAQQEILKVAKTLEEDGKLSLGGGGGGGEALI